MPDLTERAQRILELQAKATPGKWQAYAYSSVVGAPVMVRRDPSENASRITSACNSLDDAAFIAAAHESADLIRELLAEIDRLRDACARMNGDVCETLGRALNYPRFADDQANFPGAKDCDGVCVGEHVAESIAMEAAREIEKLRKSIIDYQRFWIRQDDVERLTAAIMEANRTGLADAETRDAGPTPLRGRVTRREG